MGRVDLSYQSVNTYRIGKNGGGLCLHICQTSPSKMFGKLLVSYYMKK